MARGAEPKVVVDPSPDAVVQRVCSRLLRRVAARAARHATTHLSLTGGTMGARVLAALAEDPRTGRIDWSGIHFWWSDERFVPAADPQRNDAAASLLLDRIHAAPEQVHRAAASDQGIGLDEGAQRYADDLSRHASAVDAPWPAFDVCLLGVGPDGHVASLFPDRDEVRVLDRAVVPVRDSPKPPPERISMTLPVIRSSRRVWLVVSGADKASAVGLAVAGASETNVPAAGARGLSRTVFFLDAAAAAQLPDGASGRTV